MQILILYKYLFIVFTMDWKSKAQGIEAIIFNYMLSDMFHVF